MIKSSVSMHEEKKTGIFEWRKYRTPFQARKICLGHIDGVCFSEVLVSESLPEDMLSRRTRTATEYGNARAKTAVAL
jgi:hypothetical protein